jgi:hypothetical protein
MAEVMFSSSLCWLGRIWQIQDSSRKAEWFRVLFCFQNLKECFARQNFRSFCLWLMRVKIAAMNL